MKRDIRVLIALAAILVVFTPLLQAQRFGAVTEQVNIGRLEVPRGHLVDLQIDPNGSVVRILSGRDNRTVIDSSFDFVSANCTNCGTGCPPLSRTVEVVLQANEAVPGGYGVSSLSSANYTVTNVSYSTQATLIAGQQVTVTITGDVLDCGTWFKVYFSMCEVAPASWAKTCPIGASCPGGTALTRQRNFAVDDGFGPQYTKMIRDGSTFYGMTMAGGASDYGVIFKMETDGTGYTVLHSFSGGTNDGREPYGSLILDGSTLYGMTHYGGGPGYGVIFKIATDGSGFTVLHSFSPGTTDGQDPWGSLTIDGSILYGMTRYGGTSSGGVIFKIATDGSGYTLLHHFAGGTADGQYPNGSLTLDGSTLYGMTNAGGSSNLGVIFMIATDGSSYNVLHHFAGGTTDGQYPNGSLTLDGSTLYGMTAGGGTTGYGVVFKIATNGSGYTILHHFAGGTTDGRYPKRSLTLDGSILYGMTASGGSTDYGVVFKIATDGTGYTVLHHFAGGTTGGQNPYGSLTLYGSTLYGMTHYGGVPNGGVIFKIATDGSGYTVLHYFSGEGKNPGGSLTLDGSTLYGMTTGGGTTGYGVIFKIATDGTGYTVLHSFNGSATDGARPYGSLTLNASTLYGMTRYGGPSGRGTVFKIATDGSGFTILHYFAGGTSDGQSPYGSLTLDGSTLYGMTSSGGASDRGTVFEIATDGSGFTILHHFGGGTSDGQNPYGSLTLDAPPYRVMP